MSHDAASAKGPSYAFTSDVVIGLEIHVQLNTTTKLFCGCPTKAQEPNTAVCPICIGHPGTKPVLNAKAFDWAAIVALALKCSLNKRMQFSRKTYFYPDMGKNYQITQFELPLAEAGQITLESGKTVRIKRVHMEEDPAALVHGHGCVLVDYNRSGIPLIEIVTEPDMTSADEAREFIKQLLQLLKYCDVYDENEGVVKADANISIKESGYTRVEIKNITGAKEIERALLAEIERQRNAVAAKELIVLETRGWDDAAGITRSQRLKESEDDYGYITDPDLPVFTLSAEQIETIARKVPELGGDKAKRFTQKYGIDPEDAAVLVKERELGDLFEKVIAKVEPALAARWMRRELRRVLAAEGKTVADVNEVTFVSFLLLLQKKTITDRIGQRLIERLIKDGIDPDKVVKEEGLGVVSDEGAIAAEVEAVIASEPKALADYKAGDPKAFNYLVGQSMKRLRGKASPAIINKLLKEKLG
jgi:aspartyl-tRNA(Asn)/glutamyl-tRNA(Gln) amidotransferase subunit B